MFQSIMAELYGSIFRTLRWWKIALFVIITGIFATVIIAESKGIEPNLLLYKFYAPFWTRYIIKPKISKLNYLLPGDEKSRMLYLKYFYWGILFLFILWFCIIYLIAFMTGGIDALYALKRLFCEDIIYFAYLCIFYIMTIYESKIKNKKTRKDNMKMVLIMLTVFYSLSHAILFYSFLSGGWYLISTVLSYLFIIQFVRRTFSQIKNFDTSYEGIRKPLKQSA